jgi:hypothetical protein
MDIAVLVLLIAELLHRHPHPHQLRRQPRRRRVRVRISGISVRVRDGRARIAACLLIRVFMVGCGFRSVSSVS